MTVSIYSHCRHVMKHQFDEVKESYLKLAKGGLSSEFHTALAAENFDSLSVKIEYLIVDCWSWPCYHIYSPLSLPAH